MGTVGTASHGNRRVIIMMKRAFLAALLVVMVISLAGCGSSSTPVFFPITTQILSDSTLDGDIFRDSTGVLTPPVQGMTPAIQSVFAGIDPATGGEYRAFLDFPLTGTGGVPGTAIIQSATLDFVVTSIDPNPLTGTIPMRIDLVSFQQPMIESDFDRTLQPALKTITISPPISQADFGQHVPVDVTSLMLEAQRLGLNNFQVRILRDGGTSPGLVEINDTTGANRGDLAPVLQVTYF
jgi:hypothetical protein